MQCDTINHGLLQVRLKRIKHLSNYVISRGYCISLRHNQKVAELSLQHGNQNHHIGSIAKQILPFPPPCHSIYDVPQKCFTDLETFIVEPYVIRDFFSLAA